MNNLAQNTIKHIKLNLNKLLNEILLKRLGIFLISLIVSITGSNAIGLTFFIPSDGNIVGAIQTATVQRGESLGDIGRKFDIGVYEMIESNPNVNPWSPRVGAQIIVPAQFILPTASRTGIVINIAEMRLYFFHSDHRQVSTFPIGIGKKGWHTPLGVAKIIEKKKDPIWYPPASIREAHAEKGDTLPEFVSPGPVNPLGEYAMKLSLPGYLIHGTNRPGGIGVRSSSGCIRMFPEDIEALFHLTPVGTKVTIINEPYKVTKQSDRIYFEAHEPLTDAYYKINIEDTLRKVLAEANLSLEYFSQLKRNAVGQAPKGYPVRIR